MCRWNKLFASSLLTLALMMSPLSAIAEHVPSGPDHQPPLELAVIAADLILARPLGLVATLVGSVVFIVSSPFSALGGNTKEVWNTLVISPGEYTFTRPLGRFDN